MPRGNKYEKVDGLDGNALDTAGELRKEEESQAYWCGQIKSRGVAIAVGVLVGALLIGALGTAAYFVADTIKRENDNKQKENVVRPCDSPFGSFNGCVGGVPAHSNCNSYHASFEDHFINVTDSATNRTALNVFTGMRYQCVEFSRRFLASSPILGKYVTFEAIDGASDIFPLTNVSSVFDSDEIYEFETHVNGKPNNSPPKFGDLVIYPKQGTYDDFPFGHVSVVTFVDMANMTVGIGEQNWANAPWPARAPCEEDKGENGIRQHARLMPLSYNTTTNTYALDSEGGAVQGWKRVGRRL